MSGGCLDSVLREKKLAEKTIIGSCSYRSRVFFIPFVSSQLLLEDTLRYSKEDNCYPIIYTAYRHEVLPSLLPQLSKNSGYFSSSV